MRAAPNAAPSLALAAALAAGCGAKTGLLLPDATAPADAAGDAFVRFEACVAGRFPMARREAEVLLVVDRSGSMAQPLAASERGTRWEAMYDALLATLPPFENDLRLGALIYPRVPASGTLASVQACDQLPGDGVDVAPAIANAMPVLDAIRPFPPGGATPTAAAVSRAARYLRAHASRERAQYLVLATDGAPNCNHSLDGSTCECSSPAGCGGSGIGARYCLDEAGAVASVTAARAARVDTYVIGIDGDLDARYVATLDRLAVAGGRALPGPRRYHSIRDRRQLTAAFEGIQRTVARCAYVTPSRPDDPDRIAVRAGGVEVARDASRRDGWDWTDRDYGELTFFGEACERVRAGAASVEATVACGR